VLLNISEAIIEIEHVILYRIVPVTPTMVTWSAEEVMSTTHLKEFFVHIAVYLIEEIIITAIENDIQLPIL
jgi:hypothetical protein